MAIVLTFSQFVNDGRFESFRALTREKVQPAIDAAHRIWSEENCGALYPDVVAYQAASLLATGFNGAPASKTRTSNETPYDRILAQLTRACVGSGMVLDPGSV